MEKKQNIVGLTVQKLRYQQELTQDLLAARCATHGWDVSRGTLAKIEAGVRCVTDDELLILSKALRVQIAALYPAHLRVR